MTTKLQAKLLTLAERCETLAAEIRAALSETEYESPAKRNRKPVDENTTACIAQLKQSSREEAERILAGLSQAALGQVYRGLGGSSRDAKKPKDVLVKRILWQLFDFREGHDLLQQPNPNTP